MYNNVTQNRLPFSIAIIFMSLIILIPMFISVITGVDKGGPGGPAPPMAGQKRRYDISVTDILKISKTT